jgi:hypothetical protein
MRRRVEVSGFASGYYQPSRVRPIRSIIPIRRIRTERRIGLIIIPVSSTGRRTNNTLSTGEILFSEMGRIKKKVDRVFCITFSSFS